MKLDFFPDNVLSAQIEGLFQFLKKKGPLTTETLFLKSLLEEMSEGVVIADEEGERLFLNASAQRILGWKEAPGVRIEDWPKTHGTYRMDGATLFDFKALPLVRAIHGEKTDGVEIFLRNNHLPQGRLLSVRGRPLKDSGGKVLGGVIFFDDITALKQETIRAQRMADLVAHSPIGIIETTTDARIVSWNAYAEKIYGYPAEEIVGKHYSILVPLYKVPLMQEQVQALLKGESVKNHETIRIRKDGRSIVTWCSASPLLEEGGRVRGFALVTRDVTDERLPPITENIPDGVLVISLEGRVTGWNPAAEKIFGYPKAEAVGKAFLDLFTEEAKGSIGDLLGFAGLGKVFSDFNTQGLKKDKTIADLSLSLCPSRDQQGKVTALSSVVRDITELKLAESRISQWKSIVDDSTEGVARDDLEGKILYWNKGCERIYGYTAEEVLGKQFSMLVPEGEESDFPKVVGLIKEGHAAQYEAVRRRKDGRLIHISVTLSPLRDSAGRVTGASVFIKDVTEKVSLKQALKRQEEQLLQSQKMEAVGRMAGGLAHDFNNMLAAVHMHLQLLKDENLGEEGREVVETIRDTVARATDLTQELLMFSRKRPPSSKPLDLNQLVLEETRLLQRMITQAFPLECELGEGIPTIEGDPMELRQVFMNLVLNARDAMPRGGQIGFKTRAWNSTGKSPDGSPLSAGSFAWLSVADSGTGMDAETVRHIFEPFFTTKEEGKGTGLGLAIVYSIVTKSNGKVWVESERNKGTTFHLLFPEAKGL